MTKLTKEEVITLIYGSEDDKLAIKVLAIYEEQLKTQWLKSLHKKPTKSVGEIYSECLRDLEENNK